MPRLKPSVPERSASADLFKNTLSHIPTLFGRLAYFGALRNPNSGFYDHYGLKILFGREESRRALADTHQQIFLEWLNLPVEQKTEDLHAYLRTLEDPPEAVFRHWAQSEPYRSFIPGQAQAPEKRLFLKELELLLEILACDRGLGKQPEGAG